MKQEFVTYEIALKMKELGYNGKGECLAEYTIMKDDIRLHLNNHFHTTERIAPNLPAPLWQQAEQWLREKYDLFVTAAQQDKRVFRGWYTFILTDRNGKEFAFIEQQTYQDAREAAILKALELITK